MEFVKVKTGEISDIVYSQNLLAFLDWFIEYSNCEASCSPTKLVWAVNSLANYRLCALIRSFMINLNKMSY